MGGRYTGLVNNWTIAVDAPSKDVEITLVAGSSHLTGYHRS